MIGLQKGETRRMFDIVRGIKVKFYILFSTVMILFHSCGSISIVARMHSTCNQTNLILKILYFPKIHDT